MQPGTRLNHYEVLSPLGEGGMGRVYLAEDTRLKRQVAIKVLPPEVADDPERLARLKREAQVLAQLDHPNVAGVHGLEECDVDGRVERFLVMQLAEGETLEDRLKAGPLEMVDAVVVAAKVALGLEAAHGQGIVHRDLKPANLMLGSTGDVKILDFGLAKVFAAPDGSTSSCSPELTAAPTVVEATAVGVIMGTAPYMSPEQARGKPVDQRTDIWALGCVLYEMLTGDRAFYGETATDVIASVIQREPNWDALPTGTPRRLRRLLRRCLAKDPADRLRDAGDAALMLREGLQAESGAGDRDGQAGRPGHAARLLPWLFAAAGVLVAVAALLRPTDPGPGPLRVSIALPNGLGVPVVTYGNKATMGALALSPDASQLAFVGYDGTEGNLYLRRLDGFGAIKLPGTLGVFSPFFSPGGDQLGFFDGESMLRIELPGGAPIEITSVPGLSPGASWGADGTIVFANGLGEGLWVIPANGGTARRLTELNRNAGQDSHRWPHFLPDGHSVLFVVKTTVLASFDEARLAVADLLTGEYQLLNLVGTYPSYVDSGHIVYAREGELFAAAFDMESLEAGAPFRVLGGVAMQPHSGSAMYALTQSGSLAYVAGRSQGAEASIQRLAPGRAPESLAFAPGNYAIGDISPDRRRLLVVEGMANQNILVGDTRTGSFTRLETGPGNNIFPRWSPDGEWVIFCSDLHDGGWRLYRVPADGSEPAQRLVPGSTYQLPGRLSRDASLLAYQSLSEETGWDTYLLPIAPDGRAAGDAIPVAVGREDEDHGAPSPDGSLVAYTLRESDRYAVHVLNRDTGDRLRLTTGDSDNAAWSPDGQYLFYWADHALYTAPLIDPASLTFGAPTPLADGRYENWYAVDTDGRSLLAVPTGDPPRPSIIRLDLDWGRQLREPR